MPDHLTRPRYKPSGKFDAASFVIHLAALLGVALLFGSGMAWAMARDLQLPILICLFPAITLGGLVQYAVRKSRCRQPFLAAAAGALAGVTAFLVSYHLDGCGRWGLPLGRIDQLPDYVTFRMETDGWEFIDRWFRAVPQPVQAGVVPLRPFHPDLSTHWAVFLFELGLVAGVPLAIAFRTASKPFSETAGRWYAQETLHLHPADGEALAAALRDGSVAEWAAGRPSKVAAHDAHRKVTAWYCPRREGVEPEPNVYLELDGRGPVLLDPEEAAGMVTLLPGLADIAGPALPELMAEADALDDRATARVWDVPGPHIAVLRAPQQRLMAKLVSRGLLVLPVALLALWIGLMYLCGPLVDGSPLGMAVIIGVLGVGGVALLIFTVRFYRNADRPLPIEGLIRYEMGVLLREVGQRPDALVSPSDPNAVYAEMAPRRSWAGGSDRHLIDEVLLRVAPERGAVLAEGDRQRYWIPAEAILDCSTEVLTGMQPTTAALYAVVLQVRLGTGTWELPFFPLTRIAGNNNWERAETLRRCIRALRPVAPTAELLPPPPEPPPVIA